MKATRHRRIVAVLRRHVVTSQAELAALLRREGERVTQATLSRDLEELGAFKSRLPDGRVAYRLPEEPPVNGEHVRRMLREFVVDIDASGNLVVLRTPPGGAQPVARALDTARVDGVLATVAGDDTVLIVCSEGTSGRATARRLEAMIAGDGSKKGA